ncbi:uncharacterized protein PHACADRAFT_207706 [Phanerochaete carnosa HHB-10118-sp]|uniref:Uncharacterized protein n=1 Tax=Phanerochaete carnosa (strain HHB-10118-sp) TaxID=650164 RepID=K5VY28_PHACS|nr:uncharacterized protein PHACADRAFT_207706 [Phanerochaete carnosa HHB-10118-sp]EKM56478.1 hypothetical protein PHACADRAFT_207706 [Phanerochaete carnosa HHB-10118-sp]
MVSRVWAKICRPNLFNIVLVRTTTQLRRLQVIFKAADPVHSPPIVVIGAERAPLHSVQVPSLALALSSLGRNLQQVESLEWAKPRSLADRVQEAPPRFETAVSALLRPLRRLDSLQISHVEFKSLRQLLCIIRAHPQIAHIDLTCISVLQGFERSYWPPSVVLNELNIFTMVDCRIPVRTLPTFLSLAFRGRLDSSTTSRGLRTFGDAIFDPDPDDLNALGEIARVIIELHALMSDANDRGQCTIWLDKPSPENKGCLLKVKLSDYTIEIFMDRDGEATISNFYDLDRVVVSFKRGYSKSAEELAQTLAFLDHSLCALSSPADSPHTFDCHVSLETKLYQAINATFPDVKPFLSAEERIELMDLDSGTADSNSNAGFDSEGVDFNFEH